MRRTTLWLTFVPAVASLSFNPAWKRPHAASIPKKIQSTETSTTETTPSDHEHNSQQRRLFLSLMPCIVASPVLAMETPISIRPTVYRIDSTIPPTLRAFPSARQQQSILSNLGRGSGTPKEIIADINLNNILNRAVFGTIEAVQSMAVDTSSPASFVCLAGDPVLGLSLTQSIVQTAKKSQHSCAIGIGGIPIQAQTALDAYAAGTMNWEELVEAAVGVRGSRVTMETYQPVLDYARASGLRVLGLDVDTSDAETVRKRGLQGLDPSKREGYVVDPQGFINQTSDPKFRLYTDRVLLRDVDPDTDGGNTFAERILSHEAAATVLAKHAADHISSVLISFLPVDDVRYMQGINGRLPRIFNSLSTNTNNLTDDDVTTILLNPSTTDSLSETRRLRLEVGTGPDTIQYQMKLADYIWFSSSPPVYLLPRIMDY